MYAYTNGSERLRIDSSGNVGIGTSSPARTLDISTAASTSPRVTGTSSNGAYLDFHNNAATTGRFRIGQGYASGTDNIGFLNNEANADIVFGTNNTEAARIDSSGNLLVGTTNANPAENNVAGIGLLAGNAISVTDDGGAPIQLNRKTSDGSIAMFRKDGTAVGSVGVSCVVVLLWGWPRELWCYRVRRCVSDSCCKFPGLGSRKKS